MADLYDENDLGIAYYRTKDQLRNFKLRVCLKRITSNSFFHSGDEDDLDNERSNRVLASRDIEYKIFHWQEKVFSQREIMFYSQKDYCEGILSEKYHESVCKLLKEGAPRRRLFTYVNNDKFLPPQITEACTTSQKEQFTSLAKQVIALRERNKVRRRVNANVSMNEGNIIDLNPNPENRLRKRMCGGSTMRMYIMADLSPKDGEPRPENERVLCAIEADSNGVISLRPDLSKGRKPYAIGSSGLGRDVFEYTIEHASNDISSEYCEQEQKMYRELYQRHNSLLATFIGKEFETVERNVLRVMLFGEIESARNFEYDNLYLHFFVELPRGWSVPPSQELSWVTQTCQTKVEGKENVAYYSFPFDLELFYQLEQMQSDADEKLPSLPILYIEVLSMDSWHRYRTEGYTHYVIPSQTGVHKETLNCWRPTGVSVLAELRRFFIGGSPELEDPTYTGVPSTFQGNHLSKFGFRTETTGTVNLRLNVMMQSKALSDQKASSKASSNIMQSLGLNTLQSNVMQVLVALRNAQRRMRLAKEKAVVMRDYQTENTET